MLTFDVLVGENLAISTLPEEVRHGLSLPQKELSPRYFYDERGSLLFEKICELPEYYVTRAEVALLRRVAGEVARRVMPRELVELGPGSTRKARILLDAMASAGTLARYVPVDVSRSMVLEAGRALLVDYPGLRIHGIVGDFLVHLGRVPRPEGRRLVAFLGSTLGNLDDAAAVRLLAHVRRLLRGGDRFLLGVDLVKDRATLERAYDDAAGVTAEFNKNILSVLNRSLQGSFDPARFEHVALWNERESRVEMHLESTCAHTVRLETIGLDVSFRKGETIRTEISRKWTRASLEALLERTGLAIEEWFTDGVFALALVKRSD